MGGKGGSPPPTPDYTGAAQAQAAGSQQAVTQQTWANRPSILTPFGAQTWTPQAVVDPSSGQNVTQWSSNIYLSPAEQQAVNAQQAIQAGRSGIAQGMLGQVAQQENQPLDWSSFAPMAGTPQAGTLTPGALPNAQLLNPQVTQQIYGAATANLDPQWAAQQNALQSQLANQGITPGSTQWNTQMDAFARQKAAAYGQAQAQATQAGIGAAQGLFGEQMQAAQAGFGQRQAALSQNYAQQMQSAQYQNQLRQSQIAEDLQRRGFTLNQVQALLSGQQVGMPQMPSFATASAAQAPQLLGAAQSQFGAAADLYNLQAQQAAAPWAALTGLAGAGLQGGFFGTVSDARAKRNVAQITNALEKIAEIKGVTFEWARPEKRSEGRTAGLIAQDVDAVLPEAVDKSAQYWAVDYTGVIALAVEAINELSSRVEKLEEAVHGS